MWFLELAPPQVPVVALASCVTLGSLLKLSVLHVLMCKVGVLRVSVPGHVPSIQAKYRDSSGDMSCHHCSAGSPQRHLRDLTHESQAPVRPWEAVGSLRPFLQLSAHTAAPCFSGVGLLRQSHCRTNTVGPVGEAAPAANPSVTKELSPGAAPSSTVR